MNKEAILNKLKPIVAPYVQNKEAFEAYNMQTDFMNDLEINSANLVDIVLDVEDAFDIEIDNDSMERMLTVEAAVEIIQVKLRNKE